MAIIIRLTHTTVPLSARLVTALRRALWHGRQSLRLLKMDSFAAEYIQSIALSVTRFANRSQVCR